MLPTKCITSIKPVLTTAQWTLLSSTGKQAPQCLQDSAHDKQSAEPGQLAACKTLFAQLPWEDVSGLDVASIKHGVRLPLLQYLTIIAGQASAGNADAADLVHSVMTVWHSLCSITNLCRVEIVRWFFVA